MRQTGFYMTNANVKNLTLIVLGLIVFWSVYFISRYVGISDISWKITGVLFLLLVICDHVITKVVMDTGKAAEANPIAAFLIRKFGHLLSSVILILVGITAFSYVWINWMDTELRLSVIAAYSLVPMNGIFVYFRIRNANGRNRFKS